MSRKVNSDLDGESIRILKSNLFADKSDRLMRLAEADLYLSQDR